MLQVKENKVVRRSEYIESAAAFVARRLREIDPTFALEFLGPSATLVPIPRSSLQRPGALWPAMEIANALHAQGFGARVLPSLTRSSAVAKAATSASKDHPKAQAHYDSLRVNRPIELPSMVTLIDDVVTRGAQPLGAAWSIWAARHDVEVRAFAVIRTISNPEAFTTIADPRVGLIKLRGDECFRAP